MGDEQNINHFPQIIAALHQAARESVKKAALDIEGRAKVAAPIATGALKNSIYTLTSEGGAAQGDLPPVEAPEDDLTAIVAVGMSYGVYQEFGTSHMPPHPFITPAVEAVRPSFEAAMEALGDKLAQYGVK